MHPRFAAIVNSLHSSFERLMACEPHTGQHRLGIDAPKCGVYLFSEGDKHLYVGRTDRLRIRHKEHWAGSGNDAPFAFKLARHSTNNFVGKGRLTRKQLELDPAFKTAFEQAKYRVATMQFRWVEEADANKQCLLEIYATTALNARYNDFSNH
jgi:hypothetical protein